MDLELRDKVVIVTGGTGGLGLALASNLVREGARVAVCGRDRDRVEAAAAELRETGEVLAVAADVSRPDDLALLVDRVVERWGRIDGLVNNAGRAAARPVADLADDEWQSDIDLKLMAAVRLVRLALPHLHASGGSIVNTLAISARAPAGASSPSSVTRAAGLALTKALSKELGPGGVRVNAILLGLLESGQWERLAAGGDRPVEDLYAELAANAEIPLGRVGPAAAYADLASFLLSPRAGYITGAAVNLDGGLSPVP